MKKIIIISLIAIACIWAWVITLLSMSKYCLFSAVDGQLLDAGKPLAWAKVIRQSHSHWFDGTDGATSTKEGIPRYFVETTTTDSEGRFHFGERLPNWSASRLVAWLPHEPYIDQSITTFSRGIEYTLYAWVKRNYDTDGELKTWKNLDVPGKDGYMVAASTRPISIACDLTNPETAKKLDDIVGTTISGICTIN